MKNEHDLTKLRDGDEQTFKEIVLEYQSMVYNVVLSILKSTEDAEDIAQEVFVEVYLSAHQFKGESKLSTWIYRIALTKAWDYIRFKRRKKRFAPLLSIFSSEEQKTFDIPDFHHPGVELENKERSRILFAAIDKLSENQQTAFILHKIEGQSYHEIATIMDTSLSSVESLMHRAKMNLQKRLKEYYFES